MRTTLNIDEKLLNEVVEATGEKTKSKAVNTVLEELVRARKVDKPRALAGKIDILYSWRDLEELELEEQNRAQW